MTDPQTSTDSQTSPALSPASAIEAPSGAADEVTLDATVPPNEEATRRAWQNTIAARGRRDAAGRELFRRLSGASTPSSVVRSAEGVTQFNGLYENGNGALSVAARLALKDRMGAINPGALQENASDVSTHDAADLH